MSTAPPPPRVFVTGGTGFLGRNVLPPLQGLLPAQTRFTLLSRQATLPAALQGRGLALLQGDLADPRPWLDAMAQHDAVLWMGADRDHTKHYQALRAANVDALHAASRRLHDGARVRHIVYISSVSAADQPRHGVRPIDETCQPHPRTDYGRSKLHAEQLMQAAPIPTTVFRLPFVYGPAHAPASFLAWCRTATQTPLLRTRRYPGSLSLLFAPDFAGVLAAVLQPVIAATGQPAMATPHPAPAMWCVSDGRIYAMDEILALVGSLFGTPLPERRHPVPALVQTLLSQTRWRYWQHAALTPGFFALDAGRLLTQFPQLRFTPLHQALRISYGLT